MNEWCDGCLELMSLCWALGKNFKWPFDVFCLRLCWRGQATPWMSLRGRENMEVHLLTMCSQEHTQESELRWTEICQFFVLSEKLFRSVRMTKRSFCSQVFVGKIPRDLYEDELVPLFESAGAIWDLRLMMDPLSGQNRGYAFITYCNKDDAQKAVKLVSSFKRCCKNLRKLKENNVFNSSEFKSTQRKCLL